MKYVRTSPQTHSTYEHSIHTQVLTHMYTHAHTTHTHNAHTTHTHNAHTHLSQFDDIATAQTQLRATRRMHNIPGRA